MTKKSPDIRLAERSEIPVLAAIQLEAASRFPDDVLPEPMRSSYTVSRELMEHAVEKGRLWIAHIGDNIPLGYAVWREVEGTAILEQVDVMPQYGKQGIGTFFVRHSMAQVLEAGHNCLYLTTFSSVPWNAPFYSNLGFTIVEDEKLPDVMKAIIEEERKAIKDRIPMRCILN